MQESAIEPKGAIMRIDYRKIHPAAMQAMVGLEQAVHEGPLEPELLELIKMRASQINGCAYCLDMHSKDARARGESEQRLYLLNAWREAPFYSDRERAALAWCESITLVAEQHAPDDVYQAVSAHFSDEEIVSLTLAIVAINGWNRFAIGLESEVGHYVSPHAKAQVAGEPA
jgi:AhpD family alkylhydroperoxidase